MGGRGIPGGERTLDMTTSTHDRAAKRAASLACQLYLPWAWVCVVMGVHGQVCAWAWVCMGLGIHGHAHACMYGHMCAHIVPLMRPVSYTYTCHHRRHHHRRNHHRRHHHRRCRRCTLRRRRRRHCRRRHCRRHRRRRRRRHRRHRRVRVPPSVGCWRRVLARSVRARRSRHLMYMVCVVFV